MPEQPVDPAEAADSGTREHFRTTPIEHRDHDIKRTIIELRTECGTPPIEWTPWYGVAMTNRGPLQFPIHADSLDQAFLRFQSAWEDFTRPKPKIVSAVSLPADLITKNQRGLN